MFETTQRKTAEMEEALLYLMYQFRQINEKYGLIINEEIDKQYEQKNDFIHLSIKQMTEMEQQL